MTPGPDLALITRLVLTRSPKAAVFAAFGMITAGAAQAALGALGLAVFFAGRPHLFQMFQWTGAGVLLVWAALAVHAALHTEPQPAPRDDPSPDADAGERASARARIEAPSEHDRPMREAYAQGVLCTGSNPKVGTFLMAFLPQFAPRGLEPAFGVTILAACYLALGLVWLLTWARLVRVLARHLYSVKVIRLMHWLTAVVFSGFAVRFALWG